MTDPARDERQRLIRSIEQPGVSTEWILYAIGVLLLVASILLVATGLADDIRATRAAIERCGKCAQ